MTVSWVWQTQQVLELSPYSHIKHFSHTLKVSLFILLHLFPATVSGLSVHKTYIRTHNIKHYSLWVKRLLLNINIFDIHSGYVCKSKVLGGTICLISWWELYHVWEDMSTACRGLEACWWLTVDGRGSVRTVDRGNSVKLGREGSLDMNINEEYPLMKRFQVSLKVKY